jgi:hypothetical protein
MATGRLARRAIAVAPIKAPAMNITLGSIGTLALGTALTVWNDGFEYVFGDASDAIRRDVLIATIAAIVVIASVDMLARAIATRHDGHLIVPWGKGWTASVVQPGLDKSGYMVAGLRARDGSSGDVEYLLAKAGETPSWHRAEDVQLTTPPSVS